MMDAHGQRWKFISFSIQKVAHPSSTKAKLWAISSDTHQLQLIKLHNFKLERFKSI